MSLHRTEVDVRSGKVTVIQQTAYKNDEGDVVVLDNGEKAPEGFYPFDPSA